MLHLLLAFATIAFALNSLEVQNEQLKKTNEALRNALRAMKTNKEATVVAEVMVGAEFTLLRYDTECTDQSKEKYLGKMTSVEDCASACMQKTGCKTFIYGKEGKAGQCYDEGLSSEGACSAWEKDQYDFYQLNEALSCYSWNGSVNQAGDLSVTPSVMSCESGQICMTATYDVESWSMGMDQPSFKGGRSTKGFCVEAGYCQSFRASAFWPMTNISCEECSRNGCNNPNN